MKELDLEEYGREIIRYQNAPGELDNLNLQLSGWYAYYSSQLIRLDLLEAKFFVNTKGKGEEKISDDMVKALWKITEEGAEHVKVKQIVKTTEKLMSNIKASIRRSEIESRI